VLQAVRFITPISLMDYSFYKKCPWLMLTEHKKNRRAGCVFNYWWFHNRCKRPRKKLLKLNPKEIPLLTLFRNLRFDLSDDTTTHYALELKHTSVGNVSWSSRAHLGCEGGIKATPNLIVLVIVPVSWYLN
jgi:hypothetical protein